MSPKQILAIVALILALLAFFIATPHLLTGAVIALAISVALPPP